MIFDDKTIMLKDGREAILRSPRIEDAAGLLAYIKKSCGETEFIVRYPEEWASVTVESEENWVRRIVDSKDTLAITCFVDGKVVGNCEISFRNNIKTAHRAVIGITILKDYWNLGIGSAMFKEMLSVAEAHGSEIVELEFMQGNDRAKALYEKFGFRVCSEKPNAYKLRDGSYASEFYMQKILKK